MNQPASPKVSIITPSFNQGRFIADTIRSVASQNCENLEYIIIDGGSRDNTLEVIKSHLSHISFWVSEKDQGQGDAFNKGMGKASGDIIGWINSDDYYSPTAATEALAYLSAHPDVDVVFGDYQFVDERGNHLQTRREIRADLNTYLWAGLCPHANCAGFFRRRFFDRVGLLRQDLHFLMDYEFYLRGLASGARFAHVRSLWGHYRIHGSAKTSAHGDTRYNDELAEIRSYYLKKLGYEPDSRMIFVRKEIALLTRKLDKLVHGCYNFNFREHDSVQRYLERAGS